MKQKRSDYHKELLDFHKKFIELRNCGNADHLTNEDGSFKPTIEKIEGQVSIGHLEEACQWLYYRNDIDNEEKLKKILTLEGIIQKLLGGIRYVPYWSEKIKNKK